MAATQSALEDVLTSSGQQQERRLMRPQPDQSLNCPRCDSTNTKFCYYNNYSLSQPRYFCKACRRYWTKGGSLRNVPVGGGCRRNKTRPSSSSKKSTQLPTNSNPLIPTSFPSLSAYDPNDLTLGFEEHTKQLGLLDDHDLHASSAMLMGSDHLNATHHHHHCDFKLGNPCTAGTSTTAPDFLDAFRSSFLGAPSNNNLHNFYRGEMENFDGGDNSEDMVMPYKAESTMSTAKHEFYDGRDHGENKMFNWNFPWHAQLGSGEGNNMGSSTVESERECWNGSLVGSSWHGLVNSSLM